MIYLDYETDGFQCLDGPEWSLVSLPNTRTYPLHSVAVGGGIVVAVSNNGGSPDVVYSLDDGETWADASISFGGGGAYSPTYGDGWFLAGINAVKAMRSSDGINWSETPIPVLSYDRTGFVFDKFLIIGVSDYINYSTDHGANWTVATTPSYSTATTNAVDNGTIAVIGGAGGGVGFVLTSTDGITWSKSSAPWGAEPIESIATDGSRFVAVGSTTNSDTGYYSDDGTTWTAMTMPGIAGTKRWRDVIYNGGIFIAISQLSTDIGISDDGINWTLSVNGMVTGGANSLAASGNNYVAQLFGSQSDIRVGRCR